MHIALESTLYLVSVAFGVDYSSTDSRGCMVGTQTNLYGMVAFNVNRTL